MVGERKGIGGEGMGVDLIKNVLYACMKRSSTKEESKEEKPVSVSGLKQRLPLLSYGSGSCYPEVTVRIHMWLHVSEPETWPFLNI